MLFRDYEEAKHFYCGKPGLGSSIRAQTPNLGFKDGIHVGYIGPMQRYRPDIDGLRALAVLAVVLYHFSSRLVSGGFVGVDVFFVISGYLITGIIVDAIDAGRFTFAEFYVRRVRRIFPALMLVCGFAMLLGWFVLFSPEYQGVGRGIFWGTLFWSNIKLFHETGYFDQSADLKPMLHLWSLGVEEQFYLIWPVVLILFRKKLRLLALAVLATASFAYSVLMLSRSPSASFYLPMARFWELGLGGALALGFVPPNHRTLRELQSAAGLLLILTAAFLFDSRTPFPGWNAILPALGAYLLISAGPEAWLNRKILSHPAAIFVGLISYPLYLWHWPLLYFARVTEAGAPSALIRAGAVALAALLAWLTYRFLEIPIRERAKGQTAFTVPLVAVNIAVMGLSYWVLKKGNLHDPMGSMISGRGLEWTQDCASDPVLDQNAVPCLIDKRENPTLALIGDSHAKYLYPGLVRNSSPGKRWMLISRPSCEPLLPGSGEECQKLNEAIPRILGEKKEIRLVLLTGSSLELTGEPWGTPSSEAAVAATFGRLRTMIEALQHAGKKVAFVVDNPAIAKEPGHCFPRFISLTETAKHPKGCAVPRGDYEKSVRGYRSFVNHIRTTFPDVLVYDPTDRFCKDGICSVLQDGASLYSFTDHISDVGNELVGGALIPWLDRKPHSGLLRSF